MIKWLKGPLSLALMDQVLVSATSLLLTFWLINQWTPAEFGVFAILVSVSMTGLAAHQALAGSQLALMLIRAGNPDETNLVLATTWAIALGIALIVAILTVTVFIWFSDAHSRSVPFLAGLFVGLHVCREHVRTYHFARFEAGWVLINDALYALAVLIALVIATQAKLDISLEVVIATLCLATVIATSPTLLRRASDFVMRYDRRVRRRMKRLWHEHARWALMGAAASEMQTRGHVLAVSFFFSVADLGIIQAALTLLRPVGVLGAAWGKVARPVMAKHFANARPQAAARYANRSALGFLGATAAYLLVLWLAWPLLSAHVLPDDYKGLGEVIPLWGIAIIVGLLRTVYSLQAQCVPLFRESFFASMIAMVTIFLGLIVAVLAGSAASTVLVVAAGEGAATVALILIIRRHLARLKQPASPSNWNCS
ncbi:lipopolysaccharide biosynthesis protein [Geminicoccus roseus]|uniref:lipopolysaccharide biosynthesis protein n=1 Tax=Geminicoccus roseus TaxID=404900 RepID=UPI0004882E6A|nr:hypothetical protein [Geminicoccus roseus]